MNKEKVLDEVWRKKIRDKILTSMAVREDTKKSLRKDCETDCGFYPICKKVFELENET